MSHVKSPYNFVPAPIEDQVFTPEWASCVSHDIPFEDGESGEITLEITAETPIFIRDGQKKLSDEDRKKPAEFSHFLVNGQKQYFIPATSLKGMVRNVLEIMSFSRLNKNLVQNNRYAQRDISKADTQYMQKYNKENLCAGWLKEDKEGNWSIEKCKSFAFIDHKELKDKLGIPFRDLFLVTVEKGKPRKLLKTAKEKYDEVKKINVSLKQTFVEKKQTEFPFLDLAEISEQGKQGSLVFTGQAAARFEIPKKKANGKTREFVFFDDENPVVYSVPPEVQKDFRFIYNDHDAYSVSKDWKYFRDEFLQQGKKVPVFFSPGENHTVRHFGMAYMYKLPYDYNVHSLNPIKDYKTEPDLAHTIFGQAAKGESWKGRVFFGHAMADTSTVRINSIPVEEILATPKASYFPYYLGQFKEKGEYYTYDDEGATIRGFKRYPVRKEKTTGIYDEKQKQNKKTWSKFLPILEGAKFTGKIRFHNLKKEELGALLSALTFHDNGDLCFHSLGGAKPYGYGRISLKAKLKTLEKNWTYEECIQSFEEIMDKHIPNWINSSSITELFTTTILGNEENLLYPTTAEYQNYKKREIKKEAKPLQRLESYSTIQNKKPRIKRFVAFKPTLKKLTDFPKSGGKVDVKVVGQEGLQMKVEVYLEGFEGKLFQIRYPEGLKFFGKDSILEADIVFPQPKNRNQFNLNNPKRKD